MASPTNKTRPWQQWSEDEARAALARLDASGMSIVAFARSIGVSPQRINYWRSKLATAHKPEVPSPFVAVTVASRTSLEIALGPLSLRIPEGTSAERVAELFSTIARKVGAC